MDVNFPDEMLIGELARRAGVSIRTIRFYISEGLLPSPGVRGRYTVYGEEHLNRLMLIQRLKEVHLPLKEIRTQVNRLTGDKVRELLDKKGELDVTFIGKSENKVAENHLQGMVGQQRNEIDAVGAMAYIARILDVHTPGQWSAPDQKGAEGEKVGGNRVKEQAVGVEVSVLQEQVSAEQRRRLSPAPGLRKVKESEESAIWERIPLAQGVELHLRQPVGQDVAGGVQQLIALAKRLWA